MMIFARNKNLSSVMNLLQYQALRGSSESFLLCWCAGKQGIKLLYGNFACSSLHHTPDNTPHHMTQKPVCSDVVNQPLTVIYGLPPALSHRATVVCISCTGGMQKFKKSWVPITFSAVCFRISGSGCR